MKTTTTLNSLLILITLISVSCVQDPCAKDANGNSQSLTSEQAASCSGDSSGSTNPGNGGGSSDETDLTSLNRPWDKANTSIVIDAYEGNSIDWDKMATDRKVVGVIHRSSIGTTVDSKYKSRRDTAKARGYLWGAYHLGRPGNTITQAKLFLSLVGDDPDTLMVLDLEDTSSGKFMTIDEAEVFMEYVYEQTGRLPVVYANHSTTKLLNTRVKANIHFQQSKLWYARFKANVTDYPAGIWPNYFLWQFSSEINCSTTGSCLYNVPGTKFDMDVNVYYGPRSELEAEWTNL